MYKVRFIGKKLDIDAISLVATEVIKTHSDKGKKLGFYKGC